MCLPVAVEPAMELKKPLSTPLASLAMVSVKHLLVLCVLLLTGTLHAATYYVSPTGNDVNSGTSQAQAWRTIGRVNQISGSLQPGDRILFERGGVYRGKLTINSNGTAGSRIEVGAYGNGALPVISGSVAVTGWTVHSGNIWKADVAQRVSFVYANGAMQTMARFPNTGWLRLDNGTATSLTDSDLNQPAGHWNGATAVIRTTQWSYDTAHVTNFSGSTLTHTNTGNNLGNYQWGYFLRNKLSMLDAPGEWYHDNASGQLYLWCPNNANPNDLLIEAAVTDQGIYFGYQRQHILVNNIHLRHQTDASLRMAVTNAIEVANCTITDTHRAIYSTGNNANLHHLTITQAYSLGAHLLDNNSILANCVFTDIALHPGLGQNDWGYFGIRTSGNNMTIRENRLENMGYIGIVTGHGALVERNVVLNTCMTLNDGGGIAFDAANGMIIRRNIVIGAVGNIESKAPNSPNHFPIVHGIYFGNVNNQGALIEENTVADYYSGGIHVDHTMVLANNIVRNNVLYNNGVQLSISDFSNYNGPGATPPYHMPSFNTQYTGNVMYCLTEDQLCMSQLHLYASNWVDYGTFSGNKFFNPYNDLSVEMWNMFTGNRRRLTLERWQNDFNEDPAATRGTHALNRYEVTNVLGSNLVTNGTFDYNTNGWTGWPTQGTITHDYAQLDNGACRVNFSNNQQASEFTLRHSALSSVQNGEWYRMRFSIISNVHGQVRAGYKGQTQQNGPNMIASKNIPFSPQRRDVTIIFQSGLTDQGYCSFSNHFTESNYWIDNVEMHRVNVTEVDPKTIQPLLYNDQPTSQTFPLVGCWRDVNGVLHSGSITLEPYRSTILIKEDDALCGLTTGVGPINDEPAPMAMIFPNPVEAGAMVRLTNPAGANAQARLFDLEGRIVMNSTLRQGELDIRIPTGTRQGTYILVLSDGSSEQRERLVVY